VRVVPAIFVPGELDDFTPVLGEALLPAFFAGCVLTRELASAFNMPFWAPLFDLGLFALRADAS